MTNSERTYGVWVFEDSKLLKYAMEELAADNNFIILLWLETFPEALFAIEHFDPSVQVSPDAVLVDGDLKFNPIRGEDGKKLVQAAKAKDLLTVAFTTSQIDADIQAPGKVDWSDLRELLDDHFAKTTASQT